LDEEALQMCFRNVKHVIPLAMPAIDHAVHEHTHHICRDWFHGLCKDDDIPPPMEMMMTDEDEKIQKRFGEEDLVLHILKIVQTLFTK